MADDRLPNIDKLDGSNWSNWKVQLMNFLKARKLWKMCLGTEVIPGQEDVAAVEEYEVKVARVLSILCQTISTQYLYLITSQNVTDPKQAWNALIGQFERPSLSNKMSLKSQLFGLQMKPGCSMENHLKELTGLVERLAALGAPVDEQDQVVLLLRSLPSHFESLTTAYMAKGEVQMAELREALISFEARFMEQKESTSTSNSSSVFWTGSSGYNTRSCYGCGKYGHIQQDCTTNPPPYDQFQSMQVSRGNRMMRGSRGRSRFQMRPTRSTQAEANYTYMVDDGDYDDDDGGTIL